LKININIKKTGFDHSWPSSGFVRTN